MGGLESNTGFSDMPVAFYGSAEPASSSAETPRQARLPVILGVDILIRAVAEKEREPCRQCDRCGPRLGQFIPALRNQYKQAWRTQWWAREPKAFVHLANKKSNARSFQPFPAQPRWLPCLHRVRPRV